MPPISSGSSRTIRINLAPKKRGKVKLLFNVTSTNADGTTPATSANYRLKDSHLRNSVTEDFTSVIVVVNDSATGSANFGQLADYVALVALARVDLSADFAGTDSILRLFAAPASLTPAPARLTAWDLSLLKTLYGVDISSNRPRRLISTTMMRDLAPD